MKKATMTMATMDAVLQDVLDCSFPTDFDSLYMSLTMSMGGMNPRIWDITKTELRAVIRVVGAVKGLRLVDGGTRVIRRR